MEEDLFGMQIYTVTAETDEQIYALYSEHDNVLP